MLKETLRISPKDIPVSQESNGQEHKPTKDFNNTREFWSDVITQGARLKKPEGVSYAHWRRNIRITKLYLFQQHLAHEGIGKRYRITRERTRQIVKDTTLFAWDNSDDDTKNRHPKEGFSFRKPESLETTIRRSIGRGGKSARIRKGLLVGLSIRQIQQRYSFTTKQISNSRRVLRMRGVEVPYFNDQPSSPKGEELAREIREAENFEKVQDSLYKVTKGFLYKNSRGDDPLLVSLKTVVKECGIRTKNLDTLTLFIRSEKIAVGKTPDTRYYSYFFIRTQDKDLAIETLKRQTS